MSRALNLSKEPLTAHRFSWRDGVSNRYGSPLSPFVGSLYTISFAGRLSNLAEGNVVLFKGMNRPSDSTTITCHHVWMVPLVHEVPS